MVAPRRPGCLRLLFRGFLVLAALLLGMLAWDVWQLRTLRPPEDATFEGFVRAGRKHLVLRVDEAGERLYWAARSPKTVVQYSEWPVYEFDRSGRLINWTPGTGDFEGMMRDDPVRMRGTSATLEEARAWLRPK